MPQTDHTYRLIVLLGDVNAFVWKGPAHIHAAHIKNGALTLGQDQQETDSVVKSSLLLSLIRTAAEREWEDIREQRIKDLFNVEANDVSSDERHQLAVLRRLPYQSFIGKDDKHKPGDRLEIALRSLRKDADTVARRRTVFVVPDCLSEELEEQTGEVMSIVAKEADALLAQYAQRGTLDIAFLRLPAPAKRTQKASEQSIPNSGKKSLRRLANANLQRSRGLMQELIVDLLRATSESLIARKPRSYRVPGPLLMDGPTGSGKSIAADLIAAELGKTILKINMGALTETLIESRMRGHEKGVFTGAEAQQDGWFAKAAGGVLFLDELQNASLTSQAQLLDLLDPVSDEVSVSRMGQESAPTRYNVKVILAVNKPVQDLLASGRLREDLYHRVRSVVKFRSFSEILDVRSTLEDDALNVVRRLFYLYRWKSAPYYRINGDKNGDPSLVFESDRDLISLFPEIDPSIVKPLSEFCWDGNYRQFERFVYDIYDQCDVAKANSVDVAVVERAIEGERARLGMSPVSAPLAKTHSGLFKLVRVQHELIQNRFNIGKTVDALRADGIELGSRQSLRSFLKENLAHLDKRIATDSKVVSFIQRGHSQSQDRE